MPGVVDTSSSIGGPFPAWRMKPCFLRYVGSSSIKRAKNLLFRCGAIGSLNIINAGFMHGGLRVVLCLNVIF